MKKGINERQKKYMYYNLERAALYYPNRYKRICKVLFSNGFLNKKESEEYKSRSYSEDSKDELTSYQKQLIKNIMWMSAVAI